MIRILATGVLALFLASPVDVPMLQRAFADTAAKQTLLFVRHGEKPAAGLGQLSCKGLNRALALPAVLAAKYGHIDAVFAPDPSQQKLDGEDSYDYVRPLATVEPTAIRFGLSIQSSFGYKETRKLNTALLTPDYRNATVLIGWEHHKLNKLVPELLASLGSNAKPPEWTREDFDSIWRVTIERTGGQAHASFQIDHQGLDGQAETCPTPHVDSR